MSTLPAPPPWLDIVAGVVAARTTDRRRPETGDDRLVAAACGVHDLNRRELAKVLTKGLRRPVGPSVLSRPGGRDLPGYLRDGLLELQAAAPVRAVGTAADPSARAEQLRRWVSWGVATVAEALDAGDVAVVTYNVDTGLAEALERDLASIAATIVVWAAWDDRQRELPRAERGIEACPVDWPTYAMLRARLWAAGHPLRDAVGEAESHDFRTAFERATMTVRARAEQLLGRASSGVAKPWAWAHMLGVQTHEARDVLEELAHDGLVDPWVAVECPGEDGRDGCNSLNDPPPYDEQGRCWFCQVKLDPERGVRVYRWPPKPRTAAA